MDHPQQLCRQGMHCLKVRRGECAYWHQSCPNGMYCIDFKKLDCPYFHPRQYYLHNQNRQNKLYRQRPENDRKHWSNEEDKQLVQWMRNNNRESHKTHSNLQYLAIKFKRTHQAIQVRIDTLYKMNQNEHKKTMRKQTIKKNNNYMDNNSDSNSNSNYKITSVSNSNNKNTNSKINIKEVENVSNLFEALKKYYKKENNNYEIRNINHLQLKLNKAHWKGNMSDFEEIVGVQLEYFEKHFKQFTDKYGKIDTEMKNKTMDILYKLKKTHENEIKIIDDILKNIKQNNWFGDVNEFKEITHGKNLAYFEAKLGQMQSNDANIPHTNMPILESSDSTNNKDNNSVNRTRHTSNSNINSPVPKRRKLNDDFGL